MSLIKNRKLIICISAIIAVFIASYIQAVVTLPGKITLFEGEEYIYKFKSPFLVNIKADIGGILSLNDGGVTVGGGIYNLLRPITFRTEKLGNVKLNMKVFGLIPLKTVQVSVITNRKIAACGSTIGVKLKLNGILILGLSDVETEAGRKETPAKDGGLRQGDLITEVDDKKLGNIEELIKVIDNSDGRKLNVKYKRDGNMYSCEVIPVKAYDDKKFHIGLWVRDNTAGIGTLTFYDPETKGFAALGHGITDIDTGTLMPVDKGEILESNILGVRAGKPGNPGELKGVFIEDRNKLGNIDKNLESGIYGTLNADADQRLNGTLYPIALHHQVKEGPATILANIDGKSVQEYSIQIQKVTRQNVNSSKGMVIKITDKKLLEATGGIVQGMSGSPIIQEGRVVGAVTHVLVNDPTRGYGIFIECMIHSMSAENSQPLDLAG